jgi:hypothetical protein
MIKPKSIPRHRGPAGDYSFAALRGLGITRVQELAGNIWTDYNEHDPGVTVLEQICYALSDIAYRADFPVADFLVGPEGEIDWQRQSLLQSESAFPTRAATAFDYREVLLDAIPELGDVTIQAGDGLPTGLYTIVLRLRSEDPGSPSSNASPSGSGGASGPDAALRVAEKVLSVFSRERNLCEDIDRIIIERVADNVLGLSVRISESAAPVSTLANIYYAFTSKLASAINFVSYERALTAGASPEEMFRGPLLNGGILSQGAQPLRPGLGQADIVALIEEVPGVVQVTASASMAVPSAKTEMQTQMYSAIDVKLLCNNLEIRVPAQELHARYGELDRASRHMRSRRPARVLPLPRGSVRDVADYLSVQYHFPGIYGVGPMGVPQSAPAQQHALAKQLKGYLLLFDQSMADLLANLANLRQLYSTEIDKHRTYFTQLLSPAAFPGLDELYDRKGIATMQAAQDAQANHDRANRMIDYLLALYGESFPDQPLLPNSSHTTVLERDGITDARMAYLKSIGSITSNRFHAVDFRNKIKDSGDRSGLEEKLSHLLAFEMDLASTGARLSVVEHILLRPTGWKPAPERTIEFRISILIPAWPARCASPSFRTYAAQTVDRCCPAHIYADIYWLHERQMTEFDSLHRRWLGSVDGDGHRSRLVSFLDRLEREGERDLAADCHHGRQPQ